MTGRALIRLLAALLVLLAAGCGRKAKPEPYSASAAIDVRHDTALSR